MKNIHKFLVPTPFPVGPVNVYLLTGELLTLVDAGPDTPEALATISQEMDKLGYQIADLEQIVITHAHLDHFGLVGKLVEKSRATILMHPKVAPWLTDHRQAWENSKVFFNYLYRQAGVNEELIKKIAASITEFTTIVEPAFASRILADREVIKAGGESWQVFFTPGHAGSSICLYNKDQKVLFSGDHLLPVISSNPLLEPPLKNGAKREPSLPGYIKSLELIAGMEVKIVLPGHGMNIPDHRQLVAKRLIQFKRRQERVFSLLTKEPKTAFQVCMELFPKIDTGELFLGISEAFNHLDVLVRAGRINKSEIEEQDYFLKRG